jgi:hypothetical protein
MLFSRERTKQAEKSYFVACFYELAVAGVDVRPRFAQAPDDLPAGHCEDLPIMGPR